MKNNLLRALRLPFISASIIPFIFGSFIERNNFNLLGFVLGLVAVLSLHLSANLINDYADSKSGADGIDKRFFGFFGGSKLIQEGVFSARFYLALAIFFVFICAISVFSLAVILGNPRVIVYFAVILFLSWAYSLRPLQLAYRRLGEFVIFTLFGPALVMGGYFIQTGIFPDRKSFLLSLPFGFLTTAILFANEVPDLPDDIKAGKFTWVSLTGFKKAFILYSLLIVFALFSIALGALLGYLSFYSLLACILMLPAIKAAAIVRKYPQDKIKLVESSKLTIMVQMLVGMFLIIAVAIL